MDRDGVIHDTLKEFGYNGSNEILNDPTHKLSNSNVVGMEIIAKNDADVTPAQAQAAARFIQAQYPNTPVFGHGQVNPGHKEATEGLTAVNAVNALRNPDNAPAPGALAGTNTTGSPARPVTTTPGTTLNSTPMDMIANLESGNRNIPQGIVDRNTAQGTPAGGYFQIIDPTWQRYAATAGVDLKQYPTAMSAPRDVQVKVASAIPVDQWGANTVNALTAKYPGIDIHQPLGAFQSAAMGGTPPPGATTVAAGGPSAPAATGQPGQASGGLAGSLPGFQPGSPAAKMAAGALQSAFPPPPEPPPMPSMQMPQAQAVGGPMMLGAGGQNVPGRSSAVAQNTLAQLAALSRGAAQPLAPGSAPGQATGIPGLPGTTLNSPSQLQMSLMTGAMSPYDLYANAGIGGGFGTGSS